MTELFADLPRAVPPTPAPRKAKGRAAVHGAGIALVPAYLPTLRRLARDSSSALEIGKAAEHLVCADLILHGFRCYLSDQGLPYDVVVDLDGNLIRIQVKATCFPRDVNSQGRAERIAYSFPVRRRGKSQKGRLSTKECDIVALVALDIQAIAYLPIASVGTTCQLMCPGHEFRGQYRRSRYAPITGFPFGAALDCLRKGVVKSAGGNGQP